MAVDPLGRALLVDGQDFRLLQHERVTDVAPYDRSPLPWTYTMTGGWGSAFLVTREHMLSEVWRRADVTWYQWRDARWQAMGGLAPEVIVEWDGDLAALYLHPLSPATRLVRHPSGAEIPGIELAARAIASGPRGVGGVVFGLCEGGELCAQRLTRTGLSPVERFHVPAAPSEDMWAFAGGERELVVAALAERSFAAMYVDTGSGDASGWRRLDLPFEHVVDVSMDRYGEIWMVGETERDRVSGHRRASLYRMPPSALAQAELELVPLRDTSGSELLREERGAPVGVRATDGVAYVLVRAAEQTELVYVDPREAPIARAGYHLETCDDGRRHLRSRGASSGGASDPAELARRIRAMPGVASVGYGSCCDDGARPCLRVYRERGATPDSLVEVAEQLHAAGASGFDVGFYAASDLLREE